MHDYWLNTEESVEADTKILAEWMGSLAERDQPQAISRYKAEHFRASGLGDFVESCPVQAQEIAQFSGKPVICPAAAKVF